MRRVKGNVVRGVQNMHVADNKDRERPKKRWMDRVKDDNYVQDTVNTDAKVDKTFM